MFFCKRQMLGHPYLLYLKQEAKTGRHKDGKPFREALDELENPIHMSQKSG